MFRNYTNEKFLFSPKKCRPRRFKRKVLPAEDKIKILNYVDSNSKIIRVAIARKFNIAVTMNGIVAKRDLLLNSLMKLEKLKRLKRAKYEVTEKKIINLV